MVKRKVNAKINLTLDILGRENGFHNLSSLVAEINIGDTISIKKRKDNLIVLRVKGANLPLDENNNAYKAAKLFMQTFNTCGVDIFIDKKIAIGGGLGGSSADIAGVLLCMKKLFNLDNSLQPLAQKLGSDVSYMLSGGYAVISGRGEKVQRVNSKLKLYLLLLSDKKSVLAKDCYAQFDRQGKSFVQLTSLARESLEKGDFLALKNYLKNDLYESAKSLNPQIEQNLNLINLDKNAVMTGSGSTVFAIYERKKQRDLVYKKLKDKGVIRAQTIIR